MELGRYNRGECWRIGNKLVFVDIAQISELDEVSYARCTFRRSTHLSKRRPTPSLSRIGYCTTEPVFVEDEGVWRGCIHHLRREHESLGRCGTCGGGELGRVWNLLEWRGNLGLRVRECSSTSLAGKERCWKECWYLGFSGEVEAGQTIGLTLFHSKKARSVQVGA